MSTGRMHQDTFAVLRHIEVHGPRTKAEISKGLRQAEKDVSKRLANLMMLGYLTMDTTTKPAQFALTGKARRKLAAPDAVYPRRPRSMPKQPLEAPNNALSATQASRIVKRAAATPPVVSRLHGPVNGDRYYHPTEYCPSARPGANDAIALPSRMGDQLHRRDGRITDLDGNPLP